MITQKMKYALKALLALADEAAKVKPAPLTIELIAKRSDTPKRFLEHILLEVRNAGIISSETAGSGSAGIVHIDAATVLVEGFGASMVRSGCTVNIETMSAVISISA